MEDSKSIGQLLKELDAMQKQFNHLNETLIVENRKKQRVKTELSSNEIDDAFFKTFSAPLIEKSLIKAEQEKTPEKELADDKLLFELEIEHEAKEITSVIESKNSKKELTEEKKNLFFSKNTDVKIDSNENVLSTQVKNNEIDNNEKTEKFKTFINQQKASIKDYSYLTIKQRLEKIQQEISLKEEAIKEIKLKNKQHNKNILVKFTPEALPNKVLVPKENDVNVKENKLKEISSVLDPTKQANATIEKPKKKEKNTQLNTKREVFFGSKLINKKASPLNPTKGVKMKSVDNNMNIEKATLIKNGKVSNQKEKKIETVDQLTILILILFIVLLVTAWVLLF